MNRKEILELIDKNPYWGEDAESVIMIRDLKKWFEFNLKEIDDKEIFKDDDRCEFVTKKEFRFEINRLWNEIRQTTIRLIGCNTNTATTQTYDRTILSDRTVSVS